MMKPLGNPEFETLSYFRTLEQQRQQQLLQLLLQPRLLLERRHCRPQKRCRRRVHLGWKNEHAQRTSDVSNAFLLILDRRQTSNSEQQLIQVQLLGRNILRCCSSFFLILQFSLLQLKMDVAVSQLRLMRHPGLQTRGLAKCIFHVVSEARRWATHVLATGIGELRCAGRKSRIKDLNKHANTKKKKNTHLSFSQGKAWPRISQIKNQEIIPKGIKSSFISHKKIMMNI